MAPAALHVPLLHSGNTCLVQQPSLPNTLTWPLEAVLARLLPRGLCHRRLRRLQLLCHRLAQRLHLAAHVANHLLQSRIDGAALLLAHALEVRQRVQVLDAPHIAQLVRKAALGQALGRGPARGAALRILILLGGRGLLLLLAPAAARGRVGTGGRCEAGPAVEAAGRPHGVGVAVGRAATVGRCSR